ncbi:MAG: hypothetical protein GY870_13910 [archaeon]|nr:hypothetical protein [archaeon]
MKYKVIGYKKVCYEEVEIIFEDNEKLDIGEQAREQLEDHDFDSVASWEEVEIENLEVVK